MIHHSQDGLQEFRRTCRCRPFRKGGARPENRRKSRIDSWENRGDRQRRYDPVPTWFPFVNMLLASCGPSASYALPELRKGGIHRVRVPGESVCVLVFSAGMHQPGICTSWLQLSRTHRVVSQHANEGLFSPSMSTKTGSVRLTRGLEPETLAHSIGIGLVATLVARFAGLGRTAIFVRLMDRAELGTWAISNNTIQLLSIVLVLGIPAGISRYVERFQRDGQLRWFLKHLVSFSVGITLLVCVVGVMWSGSLAHLVYENSNHTTLTVLTCLCGLSLVVFNIVQGILQGLRVYRINAWMLLCQSVGFALTGALLLICWRPDAVAAASAFLITTIAATAVPCWMIWSNTRTEPVCAGSQGAVGLWRQILAYSLATWGTGSLVTLNRVLDRYMLVHAGTMSVDQCLRQVGTYHIVETVTSPLLALGGLLSTLMLPHAVHLWEAKRNDETRHMIETGTKLTVLGLTFAGACIVILKRVVLVEIFGDITMESGDLLEIVLVTTIVLGAYHTVRSYMLCSERPLALMGIWLGGLAVNVVLNLVLIPLLQVKGAALACLIGSVASTAAVMALTHRAGLKLSGSTWAVCILPGVLLASPVLMLGALTIASGLVLWTDWLLSNQEKVALNAWVDQRLARRFVRPAAEA